MAQQQRQDILFPVGRMVMGNLYEPRREDAEGKPLVIKNGPDAGKPRVDFFFAVAIPKIPGHTHWSQTTWGQQIVAAGAAAFPQAYQSPAFAWKIDDGDSAVPNKKGRKPCDNEGWRGNWIVKFSGGYAPRIVTADGSAAITEPGAVKNGYFVQVFGNVSGNGSVSQPGVFVNHVGVAFAGYGEEIKSGPDLTSVGFGQGVQPLPGMSTTPLAGLAAAPLAALPGAPQAQTVGVGMPGLPTPSPATLAAVAQPALQPAATFVQPNPAFLAGPAVAATMPVPAALPLPPLPAAPVVAAEPQMTAKGIASGFPYSAYKQQGYSDDLLRQHGLIV